MPKLMKPITLGCDNGFQEYFYDTDNLEDKEKHEKGNVHCYLNLLDDTERKNQGVVQKCMGMKSGECWKKN